MSVTQRLGQVAFVLAVLTIMWLRAERAAWGQELSAAHRAGLEQEAAKLQEKGDALYRQGRYEEAIRLVRDALAMRRKLYSENPFPGGHPALTESLNNLGELLHARSDRARAELFYRDALAMYQRLVATFADAAAETETLNYLTQILGTRHGLLSVRPTARTRRLRPSTLSSGKAVPSLPARSHGANASFTSCATRPTVPPCANCWQSAPAWRAWS
jgi:tetratricopeptide (TPR) repeat protein